MNAARSAAPRSTPSEAPAELGDQWRALRRAATVVCLLACPAVFVWLYERDNVPLGWSIVLTIAAAGAFRGGLDLIFRRFIPWPTLFGAQDPRLAEEDVLNRRRAWFWRSLYRFAWFVVLFITAVFLVQRLLGEPDITWWGTAKSLADGFGAAVTNKTFWTQAIFVGFLFIANFLIFLGPMMLMGISQSRGYEPGDATWGVKLQDVRGQAEAKEEVRRVVDLWQSGELFEKAGGKRERGLLFLGAPGTGKTMLAKAIATGFNSPIVTIPGSGFAQTFIGIDALIVRFLSRKAKKLAAKWGGQCIVFIDEIDAVGMRRQALQGQSMTPLTGQGFYGQWGALNSSGDLVVEDPAWRNYLFEQRAPDSHVPYPTWMRKIGNILNQGVFPGMMGGGQGQLALNQLLVTMDGIDNPPFLRRIFTNRTNTILDAMYIIPRRIGSLSLRIPQARPSGNQIYFIGATNVPIENLDPALTRPGRMGRHVWFRTPTKEDRKDIFDLYLERVNHNPELDHPQRRDEIARITNGYSPAMIEQICSMALTNAHHEGNESFEWQHLVDAMTTIEAGTAVGVRYIESETRAIAIHEAGHATAAHVYRPNLESSRLSIRMRGGSLGHHQAFEKEERFSQWQSEAVGSLVHTLGAMAAELAFYGENSSGVGGDLGYATQAAAMMVGTAGMGPDQIEIPSTLRMADENEAQARERIMKRFEKIGMTLMNRTRGSVEFHGDPVASVLGDPFKRAAAAQILGQSFVTAHNFIEHNRRSVETVAEAVIEKQELFGDELMRLLDSVKLERPEIDLSKEEAWPKV
jgi:ATP-dependent Zn protease